MREKFKFFLDGIPFWKQLFIWLISISLVSKVLDAYFYSNILIWVIKLLGGFFVGLIILSILKKK